MKVFTLLRSKRWPSAVLMAVLTLSLAPAFRALAQADGARNVPTLKEKVKRTGTGKFVSHKAADFSVAHDDLDSLARHSEIVVVGTALENRCFLTADGKNITTNYIISVQEVIKGNLSPGSTIKLSTPGGRYSFDAANYAEVKVNGGYKRIENGKQYLLFLNKNDGNSEYQLKYGNDFFITVGGPQGVFHLPPDGTGVQPANMRRAHPAVQKYKGKRNEEFVNEARQAVRKNG
jgi:hypothetical protein